jgi:hypothetical protein
MINDDEKYPWKLFFESRNSETGLTIQLNKKENDETGLVLFSFRLGRKVDSGKGGQFIPVRVRGKPGNRDIHSWANEIVNLIQEVEEQALLFFHKRDEQNGVFSESKEETEDSSDRR